MSDIVLIVVGIVSLALVVLWVLSMLATLRLRDDVAAIARAVTERHGWEVRERKRALRLQSLLAKDMPEEQASRMVDLEYPIE